jgi:tetratricopeptide (TPR) repeat protein
MRRNICMMGLTFLAVSMASAQNSRQNALALENQGEYVKAEAIWETIAKQDPHHAEAFAHLGLLEAKQQHFDQAILWYKKALSLDPAFPGLQMDLGLALFKTNRFQDAIRPFTEELKKHPGDHRLLILLGMSHYGMGDYLIAVPYLKRAAAQDPQNLPLLLALAHACLWSKQDACVMDVYKQILGLNAESAEADMLAGEALDEEGKVAEATQQFRAAVRTNPHEPNVHFGLGYLLWEQKQYEEAAKEFQAEIENDPSSAQSYAYLGDTWVELNDYHRALPELEKAATLAPAIAFVHRDLGVVYASMDRKDEAVVELKKSIELDPKDVSPHWRLGHLYQSMGKKDEAKAELEKASTMTNQSVQALVQKLGQSRNTAQ